MCLWPVMTSVPLGVCALDWVAVGREAAAGVSGSQQFWTIFGKIDLQCAISGKTHAPVRTKLQFSPLAET